MVVNNYQNHLVCPVCRKGEVLADGRADVRVSVRCPKCGRVFVCDLSDNRTYISCAVVRTARNNRISC